MIKGTFKIGGDVIEVVVKENNVFFRDISTGTVTTLAGLKLSKQGVFKQFPELKEDKDWKKKAVKKFNNHIKKIPREDKTLEYLKDELSTHGYEPLFYQRGGHRPIKYR